MNNKTLAHIIFSGRVQGVGFRYTTHRIASKFSDITGYVRNVPNGTVEVYAEGKKARVESFISSIMRDMNYYIDDVKVDWHQARGEFQGFGVRF